MFKIKRVRTIDTVIVGWRPGKAEGTVGSLILGLYDPQGELRVVGHTSGFSAKRARELVDELAEYESGEQRLGGAQPLELLTAIWSGAALRPELVVEVSFDHKQRSQDPPRRKTPTLPRQTVSRKAATSPARKLIPPAP